MRKSFKGILAAMLAVAAFAACNRSGSDATESANPVLMFRISIDNTKSDEAWDRLFNQLKAYPECCDEVWFSTGIGIIPMDVHRENAERLARAKEDLETLGIESSIQVQMTIGHGDPLGIADEWTAKDWTGWTGSTGVEAKYCNCPRQPAYLEYMREMARLYAAVKPKTMWIDDDLRYDNHVPATDGSRIGCWCDTCLADFSAEEGKEWTRETLDRAMASDPALEERWKDFSIRSLQEIARIITRETHGISPETKMGYQKTFWDRDTTIIRAVLNTMAEESGQKVSYRLGGGAYYDKYHPVEQIMKSMEAARFMDVIGNPDCVESWCPEIESYPRHYGSRSGQAVLLEGFSALAFGMDAISMFVIDHGDESPELQNRSMLRPLQDGSDVLRRYARANRGTLAVGFRADVPTKKFYDFGALGIPILPGVGKSLGTLDDGSLNAVDMFSQPSSDIQALRDRLCLGTDCPAICLSPFIGLVIPRIGEDGSLKTLGIINCRIDDQGPVRFKLPALPASVRTVTWRELRKAPVSLRVERDSDGSAYVEIPEISPWNAGFIE